MKYGMLMVGGIRIELMTSSVSRKARREAALAENREKYGTIRALAFCHIRHSRHIGTELRYVAQPIAQPGFSKSPGRGFLIARTTRQKSLSVLMGYVRPAQVRRRCPHFDDLLSLQLSGG
jgi:hypothetical protein